MPTLGWDRAYRSGDLVRLDRRGLLFQGRADDQVKVGGRRIELGEVETALQNLPGVGGAAAAVRSTEPGNQVLVGYLAGPTPTSTSRRRTRALAEQLPAPLVPLLAVVDELPTRTSGKVDRDALPWPLPGADDAAGDTGPRRAPRPGSPGSGRRSSAPRSRAPTTTSSSSAADRSRRPSSSPRCASGSPRSRSPTLRPSAARPLAECLDELRADRRPSNRASSRRRRVRSAARADRWPTVPLIMLTGLRWVTWLADRGQRLLVVRRRCRGRPRCRGGGSCSAFVAVRHPVRPDGDLGGRRAAAAARARAGHYPRGGACTCGSGWRVRLTEASGAANLSGAPWISYYARALGAKIGKGVDLHTLPPVTGMLELGDGCCDRTRGRPVRATGSTATRCASARIRIGAGATVGARSTLLPGTPIGAQRRDRARFRRVRTRARPTALGGLARRQGRQGRRARWPERLRAAPARWVLAYGVSSMLLGPTAVLRPRRGRHRVIGLVASATPTRSRPPYSRSLVDRARRDARLSLAVFAVVTVVVPCGCSRIGLREGYHPVRSRIGWQVWATERLLDSARTILFPLYASLFTPVWLRLLGAKVGKDVEASTVLLLPEVTTIGDGAFLADDTMVASYELGGGWMRIEHAKVGKRAFLGNSGMAAPGRRVPKNGLVAVLSAAPRSRRPGRPGWAVPRCGCAGRAGDTDASPHVPIRRSRLRVARALVETCRFIPVIGHVRDRPRRAVRARRCWLDARRTSGSRHWRAASSCSSPGAVAAAITVVAKWLVVGRIARGRAPAVESFVWRNEVSDTFVEMVAAPWFANAAAGTPVLDCGCGGLGAKIGRGVWCETYWLPEADLVTLGDGATVNRGCVVQTHLFHDRVMSMDTVNLEAGATLGPHSVVLPAAAHRRGRHRRPGVAGDARRHRAAVARGGGQSDRPLGGAREGRATVCSTSRSTRTSRRAATRHTACPGTNSSSTTGQHQPARTAGPRSPLITTEARSRFALDLRRSLRRHEGRRQRSRDTSASHRQRQAGVTPAQAIPAGGALVVTVAVRGHAGPLRSLWGEVGWEELDRRRAGRQPAQRGGDLVPVQRPPEFEGPATGSRSRPIAVLRGRQRRAGDASRPGPARRPGCTSRPSRRRPTWRPSRSGRTNAEASRCRRSPDVRRPPAAAAPDVRRRLRPAAPDDGRVLRLFGPYPFADYTVVVTDDELEIPLEAQGLSIFGANH